MKEITIQIEGQDFIIDLDKAKELGVIKENPIIKDFNVGDVFLYCGSKVIIVKTGYNSVFEEQRYSLAGLYGTLNLFSSFGKEGATKEVVLGYLNGQHANTKFLKNIDKDIRKFLETIN
jgi:hypothetical protein